MKHLKKLIKAVIVLTAGFLLLSIVSTSLIGILVQKTKIPEYLGNSPQNISFVKKNTDPNDFTFAVVGDVKSGIATFEALLDIIRSDRPAFVVVLGDFADHPEIISHKLFAFEMVEHAGRVPTFLVPGNHDVNENEGFGLEEFRSAYGPEQFSFTIGKNLFLCLDNISPNAKAGPFIKYIEQEIQENRSTVERIFVFMHVPPSGLDSSIMSNRMPKSDEFLELAKKYNINYVFAGDHHGYVKVHRDNTTYIVTGGGGGKLRGVHGRFHHLTRIGIKGNMVTETVMAISKQSETLELLERNIVFYLWPVIAENAVFTVIVFILSASVVCTWFYKRLVSRGKTDGNRLERNPRG